MKLYHNELDIQNLILDNKSITYASSIEPCLKESEFYNKIEQNCSELLQQKYKIEDTITASIKNKNLYFYTAILATSSLNKNDDYFSVYELWKAKDTPVLRPTNLEHESDRIVGHTIKSFVIDEQNNIVDPITDIKDLPIKCHILIGNVLYKPASNFSDEYNKSVSQVLEEIENGSKFLSLECLFNSFDYILTNDKETKFISRNNETSFLTKALRIYGGNGEFKNYKVGRVVKDFTFCAVALVNRPANPESVILKRDSNENFIEAKNIKFDEKMDFSQNYGVVNNSNQNNKENSLMSEFYIEQNKKLEEQNKVLATQLDEIKEKFAQSHAKEQEVKISNLTTEVADITKALKLEQEALSTNKSAAAELQKKLDESDKINAELTKSNKELTDKFAAIEAEQKVKARTDLFIAGGFSIEDAEKEVKTFANLDDAQFKVVADRIIATSKPKTEIETEEKTKVKAEDINAAKIIDPEVTSAEEDKNKAENEEFASLVKNLTASLKNFRDKENGDK